MDKNKKVLFGIVAAVAVLCVVVALVVHRGGQTEKDKGVIKIGAILPLTGNASDLGESTRKGIELCLENWNEKGGVLNRKLESVFLDSKGEPKEGRMLANKLLSENTPLLVYTVVSGVALNVKEELEEKGVLHLACIGSSNLLESSSKHTLRNYISPQTLGQEVINALIDNFERKELIVFYVNNELGLSYKNAVVEAAKDKSVSIQASIPYEEESIDYRNVILNSKIQNNDVLYITGIGASLGKIIKQIRESGFYGTIVCDANLLNNSAITIAGQSLQNVYVLNFFLGEQRTEYRMVAEQYENKFNSKIDVFALLAYQGVDSVLRFVETKKIADFHNLAEQMEGFQVNGIMGEIRIQGKEIIYPLQLSEVAH